jgi:hypothetical protein
VSAAHAPDRPAHDSPPRAAAPAAFPESSRAPRKGGDVGLEKSKAASAGGLFHPLPEKRPQPSQKLGPSFQCARSGATMTGANITRQGCFRFYAPRWKECRPVSRWRAFLFSFSTPVVFTMELNPRHRHIKVLELANPAVRTRKANTFEENIAAEKAKLEAQVAQLKPGPELDALRRKIRQLDTAAHLSDWLSSPGLQPPKAQNEGSNSRN